MGLSQPFFWGDLVGRRTSRKMSKVESGRFLFLSVFIGFRHTAACFFGNVRGGGV